MLTNKLTANKLFISKQKFEQLETKCVCTFSWNLCASSGIKSRPKGKIDVRQDKKLTLDKSDKISRNGHLQRPLSATIWEVTTVEKFLIGGLLGGRW